MTIEGYLVLLLSIGIKLSVSGKEVVGGLAGREIGSDDGGCFGLKSFLESSFKIEKFVKEFWVGKRGLIYFDGCNNVILFISELRWNVHHKVFFRHRALSKSNIIINESHVLEIVGNRSVSFRVFH